MFKLSITKNTLTKGITQARERIARQAREAVKDEAVAVLADAQHRVPVRSGALRASGRVELDPQAPTARIVFGGEAAPYAVAVHEDLEVQHENGEAKFLEHALHDAAAGAAGRMGRRLRL